MQVGVQIAKGSPQHENEAVEVRRPMTILLSDDLVFTASATGHLMKTQREFFQARYVSRHDCKASELERS
ncbi:hypothetical protein GCM10007394_11690 [Salinibacterium amurskyense]|nr:hypothetical protein GCM10007394_11690 [Salinibacterium amurskyense]